MGLIRLLFLADTHLGYDLPFTPRIQRRRRGPDFFTNFKRALEPAHRANVDAVIHAGDLLYRSKVPARLVDMALEPLKEIADLGIKVFLVPGNHERSQIPFKLLCLHRNIHIFDKPKTYMLDCNGFKLALSGFPYWRENIRKHFPAVLDATRWRDSQQDWDGAILCVHHCFEGATVGPGNYTFRYNEDVIRVRDIPEEFTAVLSGHIHRFQILMEDLQGYPLQTTVLYPGSIERTSFAEKEEKKGYLIVEIESGSLRKSPKLRWKFQELPTRPMVKIQISAHGLNHKELKNLIAKSLKDLNPHSVVKLHVHGHIAKDALPALRAASLRALSPKEMNINMSFPRKGELKISM